MPTNSGLGEAYQHQINALLALRPSSGSRLASGSVGANNRLLYVVIADPALQLVAVKPGDTAPSPE